MAYRNCTIKRLLAPAVVGGAIFLSSTALEAGNFELGLDAFHKSQYAEAFRLIKVSAEKGEIRGQFILSTMYRRGLGVDMDEYEGFFWCKMAAEEGLLEAQFQLGLMYLEGEGVTEDETEAQKWLWAAADQGYPQASEVLTYIFSDDFYDEYGIGC